MRVAVTSSLLAIALVLSSGCASRGEPVAPLPTAQIAPPPAVTLDGQAASLPSLVAEVELPYEKFVLDNGLTVLVHEDRKAPVVAVSVWYNVGSKDEPKGKTGFAHLFEHLMFYGSDNLREYHGLALRRPCYRLERLTWYDRTNYLTTGPQERAREGAVLGIGPHGLPALAVDQKRPIFSAAWSRTRKARDNARAGWWNMRLPKRSFPQATPMTPSIARWPTSTRRRRRRKTWFIDKYGPNNAVIGAPLGSSRQPRRAR